MICLLFYQLINKLKDIQSNKENVDLLNLGFSTFFLNRTNRSGILKAGVIGGYDQTGNYKIDARFNKDDLIKRIQRIADYADRIHLSNEDAAKFCIELVKEGTERILLGHLSKENNFPELAYKSVLEQIENTSGSGCKALGPTIFGLPISAYSCAGTLCSVIYLIFTKKRLYSCERKQFT